MVVNTMILLRNNVEKEVLRYNTNRNYVKEDYSQFGRFLGWKLLSKIEDV